MYKRQALLTLAVSVFALTSLDTGTRLGRFLFSELFLKEDEKTWKDASGIRKFLAHPLVGTSFLVIVGCILGLSLIHILSPASQAVRPNWQVLPVDISSDLSQWQSLPDW